MTRTAFAFRLIVIASLTLALFTGQFTATPASAQGLVFRVAVGGGTGPAACGDLPDWSNPCDLQYALSIALSGHELWVQQGTYKPTTGSDRNASFVLKNGVAIYGGFKGNEYLVDQRNPAVYLTTLSGDIGTLYDNTDNSYHVVAANVTGSSAVLDGFTITGGNANGAAAPANRGGGMLNTQADPTLTDVRFRYNSAYDGAGMYNDNSSPRVTNSTFDNNVASNYGGGMYNKAASGSASPALEKVTFKQNHALFAAGMQNEAGAGGNVDPLITNVTFTGNVSDSNAGAMSILASGAGADSSPLLTNVTISLNAATTGSGGGIWAMAASGGTIASVIWNSIFWGDTAGSGTSVKEFQAYTGQLFTIRHSIIDQGCQTWFANCSSSGDLSGGNSSSNPNLRPLADNGGLTLTMALPAGSPAIDAGDDATCAAAPVNSLDQRGVPRPQDGDQNDSYICDIGAYEYTHFFSDMPVAGKEWMEPWVDEFYLKSITTGCGVIPLIYCPENPVTRAAMAVFILRAIEGPSYTPPAAHHYFNDLPVTGKEWMEPWVDEFYDRGITTGCGTEPLRYCPENPVTRAAMAVFLLRALDGSTYVPDHTHGYFDDLPVTGKEWMEPFVDEFQDRGITTGCGAEPMRYCPENPVTRAAMAVFIDRAYGLYP